MHPFQTRKNCWLAVCIWLLAAPSLLIGLATAQSPYPPPQYGQVPPTGVPTGVPPTAPYPYGYPPPTTWDFSSLFGYGQSTAPAYTGYPPAYTGYPPVYTGYPTAQQSFPTTVYPNAAPNVVFPGTGSPQPYNSNPYNSNPYNANPYATNPYQPYGYPQTNPTLNSTANAISSGTNQVVRLCQGPRFRHTWLPGTDDFGSHTPTSLEINDTDVSLVFACPNFLNSTRPLFIIPSYSQHEWEGPTKPGSDLPGAAFSAFLDTGWETNPQQTVGVESGLRFGVFSDFDAVSEKSIRIQVKALARLRLTPTATLRAGVFYLDRNKIKLLPAFGLLCIPNQDTRFDLFFPEPKLSHYVSTLGQSDLWWYMSAYYGGGAWTIMNTDGTIDEIDINDIRVMLGFEFGKSEQIRQGYRKGFFEAGYAFNRELIYRERYDNSLVLDDSLVFRVGFAY